MSERAELLRAVGSVEDCTARTLAALLDEPTLVIVEAVREWIEHGVLVETPAGFAPAEGETCKTIAARAHGVLARRLDDLLSSFGDRAVRAERALMHASLLGQHFDERVVRRVCGADLDAVLDRGLLLGILRVDGHGVYRFEHQLFADVLVQRVQRAPDRAEIMALTADGLVAVYRDLRPEATLRAAHLFRAAGARMKAYATAYEVVRVLSRSSVFDQADDVIALLARWAEADGDPDGLGWAYVHRARFKRAYNALDYASALDSARRARVILERHGDAELATSTALDEADALLYANRLSELGVLLARMMASPIDDPRALARVQTCLADLCQLRCDLEGAIVHSRLACAALALASEPFGSMHGGLAERLFVRGDLAEATELSARVAQAFAESTRADLPDYTTSLDALREMAHGNFERGLAAAEAWLASAVARRDRWQATGARSYVVACQAAIGDTQSVAQTTAALVASFHDVPHDQLQTTWAIRTAESYLRARGFVELASELGGMLDARQREIARAFNP